MHFKKKKKKEKKRNIKKAEVQKKCNQNKQLSFALQIKLSAYTSVSEIYFYNRCEKRESFHLFIKQLIKC